MSMAHAFKVYGFVADASVYCPVCAADIYGEEVLAVNSDIRDFEGNEITVLYSWLVDPANDYCDKCFTAIIDG